MPIIRDLGQLQQFQAVQFDLDPGRIAGPKIIPNAIQVTINWSLTDGRTGHNVLYGTVAGGYTVTAAAAEACRAQLVGGGQWTALAAYLATTCSLTGVTLLDVRTPTGTPVVSTGAATPGTSASPALPDEVAACITLKTARRGPSGRGRIFIPGFASNAVGAGGVILAACVTALTNWASNNLPAAINSGSGPISLGLVARAGYTSPVTGRVFPARAAEAVPIVQELCRDNHWDTQRRRGLR